MGSLSHAHKTRQFDLLLLAAARAEKERAHLLAIIEDTPDFVATADASGQVLYYNRAARRLLGIPSDENVRHIHITDTHPDWAAQLVADEAMPTAERQGLWQGETAFLTRDGREIPVLQVILAHKDAKGAVEYYSTIARDITERKVLEKRLIHMASTDHLTGAVNRTFFQARLEQELKRAWSHKSHGTLLFLDLDNFKDFNDTLGHQKGDEILQVVATLLRSTVDDPELVARYGGDEFALLLPDTDTDQARAIGEEILSGLKAVSVSVDERAIALSASIGIAAYSGQCDSAQELLIDADLAMYAAKNEGGNRVSIYASHHNGREEAHSRLYWEHKTRQALDQDRFALLWQPLFDLRQRRVVGYELLLRMIDTDGQLILPHQFLPVAERSDLIYFIDRWVIDQAIDLLASHPAKSGHPWSIHVNLSGKTFADDELLTYICNHLTSRVEPQRLVFEITETTAITHIQKAETLIKSLRDFGCRFALDDFGVGFSTFGLLRRLSVDFLKIDGSFVKNMEHDPVDRHLVKAMVEVATGLGLKTIAEFIPNEKTLQMLLDIGVGHGQGYYLGTPKAAGCLH